MSTRRSVTAALVLATVSALAGCSAGEASESSPAATSSDELAQTTYLLAAWATTPDASEGGLVIDYEQQGARATDLAMFTEAERATVRTSGTFLLRHATLGRRHGRFVVYATSPVGLEGGVTGRVKFIPVSGAGEPAIRANDCAFGVSPIMGDGVYLDLHHCTNPEMELHLRATLEQTSADAITSFGYCDAPSDCYEESAILPAKGSYYYKDMTPAVQALLDDWRASYAAWNHVGQTAGYTPDMTFACSADHTCSVRR